MRIEEKTKETKTQTDKPGGRLILSNFRGDCVDFYAQIKCMYNRELNFHLMTSTRWCV